MQCKNCGANVPNNEHECPYCGAELSSPAQQQPAQNQSVHDQYANAASSNPLEGKEYFFESTRFISLNGTIKSKLKMGSDRLFIDIKPQKFAKSPAILFEDITGVTISWKIPFWFWFLAIILFLATISGYGWYYILPTAACLIFGYNKKIIISQRNGINVVIYGKITSDASGFKEDMKRLTNIQ